MAIFTIGDLHLSLGCDKPMDVFGGLWSNHAERLLNNWNKTVGENDTVVIPGDISWAMTLEESLPDLKFLDALNGKKLLLRGNHDYWWSTLAKMEAFLEVNNIKSIFFIQNSAVLSENFILCGSRGWLFDDSPNDEDIKLLNREAQRFSLALSAAKKICSAFDETNKPEIIVFSHFPLLSRYTLRKNPCFEIVRNAGVRRVYYGHLHNARESNLVFSHENVSLTLVSSDFIRFMPLKIS